jgi:hypothetical protein
VRREIVGVGVLVDDPVAVGEPQPREVAVPRLVGADPLDLDDRRRRTARHVLKDPPAERGEGLLVFGEPVPCVVDEL